MAKINQDSSPPLTGALGRFPVLYVDPPWRYEHAVSDSRAIENQYPTMELGEICALPVAELATGDAVLFMWATSPKLAEAMKVIEAWGFEYRTQAVWIKGSIGPGYWFRQRHESLLLAVRGSMPTPLEGARPDSVIEAPRGAHSAKPPVVYELIERMYPELKRVELFARSKRDGWSAWGNEAP
jgi:N6-adenosine-specific RNA methylase IME4